MITLRQYLPMIKNGHKPHSTPIEEALAFEQLRLLLMRIDHLSRQRPVFEAFL